MVWFQLILTTLFFSCSHRLTGSDHTADVVHSSRKHIKHFHHHTLHHDHHHFGPFFEAENSTLASGFFSSGVYAIAVPVGDMILLNCRVAMLHDKIVMWLKKTSDKVSLLTVGTSAYSADPRFQLKFQYPNNWRLQINPVVKGDDGEYMCQVSTHPPKVLITNMTVISPDIKVVDENGNSVIDRYYKTGSTIELTCKAVTTSRPTADNKLPNKVLWMKDDKPLTIKTKSSSINEGDTSITTSRLLIPKADKSDSGTYSCFLSEHAHYIVNVHVLNGEQQAAVQSENSATSIQLHLPIVLSVGLIIGTQWTGS